jgi:pimeloyl-ACP methyl ester carboxylesterase
MTHGCRLTIFGLIMLCLSALAACGGTGQKTSSTDVLTYRSGLPLNLQVTDGGTNGALSIQQIYYTSVDGQTVPALLAVPTGKAPVGCLIYQGGLGQTKDQFPQLLQGAGDLRLATFTIDPRDGGARGSVAAMEAAIKTPQTLRALVLNTVVDLRVGLDYLETLPQCHHNIGYLGTSFGGVVGAILAAQDRRIKPVVLTSIGPTFKAAILVGAQEARSIPGLPVQVPGAATNPAVMAEALKILSPYDPATMVARIAPRPVMLINGRSDPLVPPIDALEMAAAARAPKTILYFDGGHNPFASGPGLNTVATRLVQFLVKNMNLPVHLPA